MRRPPGQYATPDQLSPVPARPFVTQGDPLFALGFGARLLVWGMRLWWQDKGHNMGSRVPLGEAFRLARCPQAVAAFDELMLMVCHGALRPVQVAASSHGHLTDDEAALLQVVHAFQDGAVVAGEKALEAWMPPATARLATDGALTLAREMGRGGLYVKPRGHTN